MFQKSYNLPTIRLPDGRSLKLGESLLRLNGEVGFKKFAHGNDISSRTSIINHLIEIYNFSTYLEIGVRDFRNLNKVLCEEKFGVDPNPSIKRYEKLSTTKKYRNLSIMTSDAFFEKLEKDYKFDLVFIDGLHLEYQVDKDIRNSLNHLTNNGIIVMHDCCPPSEFHQRENFAVEGEFPPWNGTVWKSFAKLRMHRQNLEMYVVNTDWGVGIIRRGSQCTFRDIELNYKSLEDNRTELLNLISVDEFLEIFK